MASRTRSDSFRVRPAQPTIQRLPFSHVRFDSDHDDGSQEDHELILTGRYGEDNQRADNSFLHGNSESDSENLDENKRQDSTSLCRTIDSTIERGMSSQLNVRASQGLIGTVRLLQAQVAFGFWSCNVNSRLLSQPCLSAVISKPESQAELRLKFIFPVGWWPETAASSGSAEIRRKVRHKRNAHSTSSS